jgi:hypothetical protein
MPKYALALVFALAACGSDVIVNLGDGVVTREPCQAGEARGCYPGPTNSLNSGTCRSGTETCVASGDGYGACEGAVIPSAQDCATPEDETCGLAPVQCTGDTHWAVTSSLPGTSVGHDIVVMPDGGIVVVGGFSGGLDLGGHPLVADESSAFVVKLNAAGQVQWSLAGEGTTSGATSVIVNAEGFAAGHGKPRFRGYPTARR